MAPRVLARLSVHDRNPPMTENPPCMLSSLKRTRRSLTGHGPGTLEQSRVDVISDPAVRAVNPHGEGTVGAVF